jgi:alpha-tubulin suppressor-like RCC1 family protein
MRMGRGHIGGIWAIGWVGGRRVVRLAALGALLVLGVVALPAVGNAAAPGQLYAFGANREGQLGNETNQGTNTPNPTPELVTLPGEVGTVIQAATGSGASLAVTSGGQLYTFGEDTYGELGYRPKGGEYAVSAAPRLVTLPGAVGSVTQAAAGQQFSLAVTSSGQLYSFGDNFFGQLGKATHKLTDRPNPTPALVTLPGATGAVVRVAAGAFHSLALTASGQLYAFGEDSHGELASPEPTTANPTPKLVSLPGAIGPVTQVAAGDDFSLAVTSSGQLYAFGKNRNGQLGSATNELTIEPNPTPARVTLPGEVGPVVQVAAGTEHTLALTATGQLYAFGDNQEGELGNAVNLGKWWPNPTPRLVSLPGARGRIVRIAAGQQYSLALTSTGELYAFGGNYSGQLGIPPRKEAGKLAVLPVPTPTRVALPANVETLASGDWADHTLVVLADLALSTSALPGGEAGMHYSAQAQATGGAPPYRWSASGLPPGLSIDPATGAISGTPAAGGSYTPTITVTDSYGIEAPAPLTLPVRPLTVAPGETAPFAAPRGASTRGHDGGGAPRVGGAATTPASAAPSSSPGIRADANTFSPSTWTVHKYLGQITHAGARSLDKPVGLAFNSAGDLFVSDADRFETGVKPEEHGFIDRYGPTGELECEIGGGFPWGELESVGVNDETGDVYVAEDFLFTASVWLLTPEGKCFQTPTGIEAGGLVSLTVDNAPGSHRGDVYLLADAPPYGGARPYDINTNGAGELQSLGSELPEPPDEFSEGSETLTSGIAIDPASGAIYLTNPQQGLYLGNPNGEVYVYNRENELQPQTLTTGEPFEPIAVAVDPSNGEVYAVDALHRVVDEFNASGEFIGEITGAHTPAGEFIQPRNVAVKPATHEVYVSDEGAHAVDIFSADEEAPAAPVPASEGASGVGAEAATLNGAVERSEGEPLSWFFRYARGSSCTGGGQTERKPLAAGEKGLLHLHAKIEELEPSTAYSLCFSDEGAEGVLGMGSAVHFETGGLAPMGSPVSVSQITPSGAALSGSVNPQNQLTRYRFEYATSPAFSGASVVGEDSFAKGTYPTQFVNPANLDGLAPNTTYYVRLFAENATGQYTSQGTSFKTPIPTGPAVEFWGAAEGETVLQARLEGDVNPYYQSTTCDFQYTPEAQYALEGFTGATAVPCAPSPLGANAAGISEAVAATADGLQAGVTYYYRLIAHNPTGTSEGPVAPATASFTTVGPANPSTGPAEQLSQHSAALTGAVNPDHLITRYHFEYASEAAYTQARTEGKQDPYINGRSTSEGETGSGASREPVPATPIAELDAGTTYHYRLVATNQAGTRYGQDQTLTTVSESTPSPTEGSTSTPTPPTQSVSPSLPTPSGTPLPPAVMHVRQSARRWREGHQLARVSANKTPTANKVPTGTKVPTANKVSTATKVPTGTTFSFSLNEQATVQFSFTQILGKAPAQHSCPASTRENAQRKSCNTAARGTLTFTGHSGTNRVAFAGRISHTNKLKPGQYDLLIMATNSAAQHSQSVSLSFTIVR